LSSLVRHAPRTLADAVLPERPTAQGWLVDFVLVVLFSVFVALCARIAIPLPFTEVPLTGLTFGVLFTGAVLGSRRGALALLLYLFEGALGLPVFAPSAVLPPGLARLVGPTGGYLVAAPLAAALVGLLAERRWDRSLAWTAFAMLLGNLVFYAVAIPWLALMRGSLWLAFMQGMLPFIPGDLIKIALAAVALPSGWALAGRLRAGDQR
jgi:biotin transport system substrate-specific component